WAAGIKSGPLSIPIESTAPISSPSPRSPEVGATFSSDRSRSRVWMSAAPLRPVPIDEIVGQHFYRTSQPLGGRRLRILVIVALQSQAPITSSANQFNRVRTWSSQKFRRGGLKIGQKPKR